LDLNVSTFGSSKLRSDDGEAQLVVLSWFYLLLHGTCLVPVLPPSSHYHGVSAVACSFSQQRWLKTLP
jgi:hypothetical protein